MKKNRTTAGILAACMCASLLAGCGAEKPADLETAATTAAGGE